MTPYHGKCTACGEEIHFDRPPEEWSTAAGDTLRAMSDEERLQTMRSIFEHMVCPICNEKAVLLIEAE